jgi:hypothetical protein
MEGFQKRKERTRDGILRVSLELFRDTVLRKSALEISLAGWMYRR